MVANYNGLLSDITTPSILPVCAKQEKEKRVRKKNNVLVIDNLKIEWQK